LVDGREGLVGTLIPVNRCQAVVSANQALVSTLGEYFARQVHREVMAPVALTAADQQDSQLNWLAWEERKQRRLWNLNTGDQLALCASNPLSTRDDVCAALVADGIAVYALYGEDLPTYQRHIGQTLAIKPHLVMDDGADLIVALHRDSAANSVVAGIEETTTGVVRARALAAEGL